MTEIQTRLRDICVPRHVEIMCVYGSRAGKIKSYMDGKGTVEKAARSDVDIGIKTSKEVQLSVRDKVSLAIELEDLLGAARVDLVVLGRSGAIPGGKCYQR